MPNAVLEAMACAVPVLLAPFIGLGPELGRCEGHYAMVDYDATALAQATPRKHGHYIGHVGRAQTILIQDIEQVAHVMKVVSFTQARNGLKAVLDGVVNDACATIITRRDSQDAVVMSLDDYNSLMETVHLLKSPPNAEHLARSIAQFKAGEIVERNLIDD